MAHLLDDLGFINNWCGIFLLMAVNSGKYRFFFLLRHFSKINKGNFVVDQTAEQFFGFSRAGSGRQKPPATAYPPGQLLRVRLRSGIKSTSNLPIVDLLRLSKQTADGQTLLFQQDFFFFVCQNQDDSQRSKGKKKEGSQQISCQNQEDTDRQKEDCR